MKRRLPDAVRQAGLGAGGVSSIVGFTLLAIGRGLALVIMAGAVAGGISSVVSRTEAWHTDLAWGIVGALLRAATAWGTRTFAVRAAISTKEQLRSDLAERLLADGTSRVGSVAMLATHGLDELDNYYRSVLPAVTSAAVIPVMIGARLLFADWLSALIVAITIILVPVFMALIGIHTSEKVSAASGALARLSDHMVELARGLPVLVGLGRAEEQTRALKMISDDYRQKTLKTLRVAFMSSLALELISTISVAIVAVSIGFRLVNGDLSLAVALLVLILAPECFAPFRDLGASFHASQDGLGALRRARKIIDASVAPVVFLYDDRMSVNNLTVAFSDRTDIAIDDLSFVIPHGEIVALQGVSGSGKSTLLGVLAGQVGDGEDVHVAGRVLGVDPNRLAWVPQQPHFVADTVRGELRIYANSAEGFVSELVLDIASRLGLVDLLDQDPTQLSPGEGRRLAFARGYLRVLAGATLLLLDEPTAHLDEASAAVVRDMISDLRGRTTIVLASHSSDVVALAGSIVLLGAGSKLRAAARGTGSRAQAPARMPAVAEMGHESGGSVLSNLALFLRPAAKRYVAAAALGTLAVLFAVSLTTVSGWLIVKASEHPSIMYLGVAIVGVRFFGIGRSALHYAERLVTHDAVFESVTGLRVKMWKAFIARGATSRKLLGGASVTDTLIGTADTVRDLAPRAVLPAAIGVLTSVAVVITTTLLHASALPLMVGCIVASLIVAPIVTLAADRAANVSKQMLQSEVLRRFAALLGAAGDLRANGVGRVVGGELAAADRAAGYTARRTSWALGLGTAIVVAACCSTAVLTFLISAPAVKSGALPIELVAVLAFMPLALIEPFLSALEAVQQWPALMFSLRRISNVISTPEESVLVGSTPVAAVQRLEVQDLSARWPGASTPVFAGLNAAVHEGQWMVIHGPSGSGKSTLLTVLLDYLPPASGRYTVNSIDSVDAAPASLRRHVSWAPQDGYLFDSTLRANLLIARPADEAPTDAELVDVLRRVGLADTLASLAEGLDTRVGPAGSRLSGGQRQRVVVARSLLTRAEVLLLDEPTAHLDEEAAAALIEDLREGLQGKIVCLVTHHEDEYRSGDVLLTIGSQPVATRQPTELALVE